MWQYDYDPAPTGQFIVVLFTEPSTSIDDNVGGH